MKIVTYNVNGIRAALGKGLAAWIAAGDYDVVCLQEVKAREAQVDLEPLADLGYAWAWHAAEKAGYSGVATLWRADRLAPKRVVPGCDEAAFDCEGRVLRTDFDDFALVNAYFPSGSAREERQAFKMEFLHALPSYLQQVRAEQPNLIVVGDYNIAHTPMDIHNPKSNKNSPGFLPDERAWMSGLLAGGMTDAYRHLHPEAQTYTWWSFRGGARANDKGWRIDYQMVSPGLVERLRGAWHRKEDVHSDHAAVVVEYAG